MKQTYQEYTCRPALPEDTPAIRELVFEVRQEYGLQSDAGVADADLVDVAAAYAHRGGFFGVVEDGKGRLVGTYGLYPLKEGVAEIRKMYLQPSARGKGLGSYLLDRLLDMARERGVFRLELETAGILKAAIGLYTKRGFEPVRRQDMTSHCDQVFALELKR